MRKKEKNILLCIREENIRLSAVLRAKNYFFDWATSGIEALQMVQMAEMERDFYDLFVYDFEDTNISGEEVLDRIKVLNPSIPILIISAVNSKEWLIKFMQKGCRDFIEKPYDSEELIHKIDLILENTKYEVNEFNRLRSFDLISAKTRSVAHEVNNYLSSIIGSTEVMLTCLPKTDPLYEMISSIGSVVDLITLKSRSLLSVGKGTDSIRINCSMRDLVLKTVRILKAIVPKEIEIVTSIPDGPYVVNGVFEEIVMMIFILVIHSIEVIHKGTIYISVSGFEKEVEGSYYKKKYVSVVVEDTGTVFVDEKSKSVLHESIRAKFGNGFGFLKVKEIIDSHDGWIEIKGQNTKGRRSEFFLPEVICGK